MKLGLNLPSIIQILQKTSLKAKTYLIHCIKLTVFLQLVATISLNQIQVRILLIRGTQVNFYDIHFNFFFVHRLPALGRTVREKRGVGVTVKGTLT